MIIKTKKFDRWARKAGLIDALLCHAVEEMVRGLIDADLGGRVYKKRIALPGKGKSGSARTLLATNRNDRWFFMFGFEKNDRANISAKELLISDDLQPVYPFMVRQAHHERKIRWLRYLRPFALSLSKGEWSIAEDCR